MATANPFDLLGDNDNDDPSQLIALQEQKAPVKKSAVSAPATIQRQPQAKMPSKPAPPAQAVREARTESGSGRGGAGRGGFSGSGRGGTFGRGRGGGSYSRDYGSSENGAPEGTGVPEEGNGDKSLERGRGGSSGPRPFRGGRRGGFGNVDGGDGVYPRRQFERRSGTGRGNELKREGSGRGNWGTATDEGFPQETEEEPVHAQENREEKPAEEVVSDDKKDSPVNEAEEKEPENKEMTLDEYEKLLEEKRKALIALKTEERKVDADKEFGSMQPLFSKKDNDEIFIKLGSDKDKGKTIADKEEKAKKSLSINEFLKPADGGSYYGQGGRSRGRGSRRGGHFPSNNVINIVPAPSIEDPSQFPTLGAK